MSEPIRAYAGFDVSTKAIDLALITAEDEPSVIMFARCALTQASGNVDRVQLAGIATSEIIALVEESAAAEIMSVAIEAPRGYGGPLLPIVGAVTGSLDLPVEWYAPSSWRKVIREHHVMNYQRLGDNAHYQTKTGAREAVCEIFGVEELASLEGLATDDSWDAAGVALAHRLEIEAASTDAIIGDKGAKLVAEIEQFLADQ